MRSTILDLWRRRHLLMILVISNLKRTTRSSTLGFLWWFLDPMLMAAVYYVVVVVLLGQRGPNQPYLLFLVCGLLPWKSFADTVALSVQILKSHSAVIKSVNFPIAVLPLAQSGANIVYFLFGLLVITAIATVYGQHYGTWPSLSYLALPAVIAVQLILTAGVALCVATVGMMFTDLESIIRHVLRIAYYMSPGLYSVEMVPERFRPFYMLNPFAGILSSYRSIMMDGQWPSLNVMASPTISSILIFTVGYAVFRRYEGRVVHYI